MKVAIIGASGKTGIKLVRESLKRGYQVVAVCRHSSIKKLDEFTARDGFTVMTAPVVSNEATLIQALAGCDAVVAVLITVRRLKATELVTSLARATTANEVKRLVFTAGEITAVREEGEAYTLRQRLMFSLIPPIMWFTPYSVTDMLKASTLISQQSDWEWTIVRAPTLRDTPPVGYRLCKISHVTSTHVLSREDYAACLLDSTGKPEHHRRTLAVVPANSIYMVKPTPSACSAARAGTPCSQALGLKVSVIQTLNIVRRAEIWYPPYFVRIGTTDSNQAKFFNILHRNKPANS